MLVTGLALGACTESSAQAPTDDELSGEVVVFAAASLADAFSELAEGFAAANPGVDVLTNHAGSQQLAVQITQGAPADVFASADPTQMEVVASAGLLDGEAEALATNTLALVVEAGNPLGIGGLVDLARDDLVVVLAAEQVPAGAYAREALAAAGVEVQPASLEADVRAVRAKVALGEADAGIVFASDLVRAGQPVDAVALRDAEQVTATYRIGVLAEAPNPAAARAFVAYARSAEAAAVLASHGFGPP